MELEFFNYDLFLSEQIIEQAKMEVFIRESILISSGENTIENMTSIHESMADDIKNGLAKIINGIKKIWEKFMETMNTLIKKDKDYLVKYKELILKKKPIDATYTMYDYSKGIGHILNSPIPPLNYASMKEQLDDDNSFIQKHLAKYTLGKSENFGDNVKTYFRGSIEQIKINSAHLNFTDMYNYCIEYEKIQDLMKKDLTFIEKAAEDCVNMVDKMAREEKIAKEATNIFEKNKYASIVYEQYITEADDKKDKDNKTSTTNPGANRTVDGAEPNGTKPADQYKKSTGDNNKVEHNEDNFKDDTAKKANERIRRYINLCSIVITSKMHVAEEAYKAYMSILKAHVRDCLNSKKDPENKAIDNSSNYSPDGKEKKPEGKGEETTGKNKEPKEEKNNKRFKIFGRNKDN